MVRYTKYGSTVRTEKDRTEGKKQIYDWDAFYKTIQKLQPKAVMAIMGDDVRWVGNEKGLGRETEWSATVLTPGIYARSEENNKRLGCL